MYDTEVTCGTYYITRAPHKSRIFSLYGRAGRPALQARLSRRVSRTGIGTARWPSHGPFDLPKGPTSRSGVTSRPTGTGDSTALTPWDKSDTVWTNVRAEGVARSSGEGGRRPRCRGRPGDPWDGSGRPPRAQAEPGRSRHRREAAEWLTHSLGLKPYYTCDKIYVRSSVAQWSNEMRARMLHTVYTVSRITVTRYVPDTYYMMHIHCHT